MEFLLIKTIHITSALILFACLGVEFFSVQKEMNRAKIKKLVLVDGLYGFSSLVILFSGFYMAFNTGKGEAFYFSGYTLYIKLAIFIAVGLLSIYPTVFFMKQRRGSEEETVVLPELIKPIITAELLLVLTIPFFAVILANTPGLI
jgi:putative membrane protein